MTTTANSRGRAPHRPAEFVFQALKAFVLFALFLASLWMLFGSSEAAAQVTLWNGDEDCSLIADFEDRIDCKLDTNKAQLDEILGEVSDAYFEIQAELCMEIAPATFAASVGVGGGVEVNAEGGGGIDFFGEKIVANAAGAIGIDASLSYEPSFNMASLTICGSPAPIQVDSADAILGKMRQNDVAERLGTYQDKYSNHVGTVGMAIPDPAVLDAALGTALASIDNPPIPSEISDVLSPSSASIILIDNILQLMKLPDDLKTMIKDPKTGLDKIDICTYKDSFPASEAKSALTDICSGLHSAAELKVLIDPVKELPSKVEAIISDITLPGSCPGAVSDIADLAQAINCNLSTGGVSIGSMVGTMEPKVNTTDIAVGIIKTAVCLIPGSTNCVPFQDGDGEDREEREAMSDVVRDDVADSDESTQATDDSASDDIVLDSIQQLPNDYSLSVNYPNPFNPETSITFALPRNEHATIEVFDVMGRKIATLLSQGMSAGFHQIRWDASNTPSGTYFYKLTAGAYTATKQMTLSK